MKVNECECYKLTSNFTTLNSEANSSDNFFAVIIRTGVHIMNVIPRWKVNDGKISVKRCLVKPPNEFPLADFNVDFNKLNREEFYLLNLNSKYSPVLDKYQGAAVYVKQIGFANQQYSYFTRPIIGILTNHGCLQLFVKLPFNWKNVIDVSLLWKNHCILKWSDEFSKDFEGVKKRCKFLNIVAFVWCNGFRLKDNHSSLLACASENGKISLWNIRHNNYENSALLNVVEIEISVHALHWHLISNERGWIIACSTDGTIKVYTLDKKDSELTLQFQFDLWKNEDYILVLNVKCKRRDNDSLLALAKDNYVLVYLLENNKILVETSYAFDKKVVGIEILNDTHVFVVLVNQKIFNLKIKKHEENLSCECIPVAFKMTTHLKSYNCVGITFSKNKLFCALSMSMGQNFDHTIIKEPRCILFCFVDEFTEVSLTTLQNVLKGDSSFSDIYDYVEYFRLYLVRKNQPLDRNAVNTCYKYLDYDLHTCRKIFQMAHAVSSCNFKKSDLTKEDFEKIEIVLAICNFLYYKEKFNARKQYLFCKWLSKNISKLSSELLEYRFIKDVSDILNSFEDSGHKELCELCRTNITVHENLKFVLCEKGHKLLRCSLTFLPVTIEPYYECCLCYSVIIQSEGIYRCVICDNSVSCQ